DLTRRAGGALAARCRGVLLDFAPGCAGHRLVPAGEAAMSPGGKKLLMSVVVPTRGRPELLRRCLRALATQDFPGRAYEVIVCDDGADPGTRRLVQGFDAADGAAPRARYLAARDT